MKALAEIEAAVAKLPAAEFRQLLQWMQQRGEEAWDRQIEEDAKSGALDRACARLKREDAQGEIVPLEDFLRQL